MTKFEKECVAFVSGYMNAGVSAEDYVKTFAERLLGVAKEELISRQIVKAESVTETPNDLEEAAKEYFKPEWSGSLIDAFIAGAKWQKEQDEKEQADLFTIVALDAAQRAKEQMMIQWTGNNLKDVIEFTGKSPRFNEWFKSWDDYEDYVRRHGNIFKMFNDDGNHLEVPVGAWIVKTPDKRCVASKFTLKQPESEKIAAAYQLGLADKEKKMMKEAVEGYVTFNYDAQKEGLPCVTVIANEKPLEFYESRGFKLGDKVRIIIVKED